MGTVERGETMEIEKENLEGVTRELPEDMKRIPPWNKQITIRGIIVGLLIGSMYSVVLMKLNLTTGIVPNLNVSAALLAFIIIRAWTKVLEMANITTMPFTKQENTVIQTCAVACYAISYGGGFASYLLGLSKKTYIEAGVDTKGNSPKGIKEPGLDWMIGFLFVISFVGLMSLVPLRKVLVIDYKLPYPSGTATAVLINGFHTAKGDKMANGIGTEMTLDASNCRKQVRGFTKFFTLSFLWSFFQWFYSGGTQCGFINFPTFGLKAWKQTFFFDFSMTYVGAGMICSHIVNVSLLLGAVLSWGIMWPLIGRKKGDWFPKNIGESSMESLNGYKVFISIALILGDGLYNFLKTMLFTFINMQSTFNKSKGRIHDTEPDDKKQSIEDARMDEVFIREKIPLWIACVGYILFSIISIVVIPLMFPQLKWYYIVIVYILGPSLSFCNAYGAGLTDMNMSYNYGKVALFILASVSGQDNGVVAGLIGCGLVKSMTAMSCDLMHDMKTGHLTLTSPRSMLVSQAIGTAIGCVVSPLTFFLYYKAFDIGNTNGTYKAPYAIIYRNMAIIGVEGFSALPHHCLQLCYGFFAFAVSINLFRDVVPEKVGRFAPLPMAMAVPFLVGASFTIDMCIGSLVVYVWQRMNSKKAAVMAPAVASGLICGDGLWVLPSCILALAKIHPPICMNFLPGRSSS